jgi:hypothetical protein
VRVYEEMHKRRDAYIRTPHHPPVVTVEAAVRGGEFWSAVAKVPFSDAMRLITNGFQFVSES